MSEGSVLEDAALVWFWDDWTTCFYSCEHGCKECNTAYIVEADPDFVEEFSRMCANGGPPNRVELSSQDWKGVWRRE